MALSTKKYVHLALKALGTNGFDPIVVLAPNKVLAVGKLIDPQNDASSSQYHNIYRILARNSYVSIELLGSKHYELRLSPAGAQKLMQLNIESITIPNVKTWDKFWRLVSYDIPISKNSERVVLKQQLVRMGFFMIQKSMWVQPNDCFDQIREITDYLGVSKYVTVMQVAKFDQYTTARLLKHFNLATSRS